MFQLKIEDAWTFFEKQNKKCALSNIELKFSRQYSNENKASQTASLR